MTDSHFLGEPLPAEPTVTPAVTDGAAPCCLCDEALGHGPNVGQVFETDPTGTVYLAHASCAHNYAVAIRAFRSASGLGNPQY